jgi:hypothetical protein
MYIIWHEGSPCLDHGVHQRQLGLMEGQPFGDRKPPEIF